MSRKPSWIPTGRVIMALVSLLMWLPAGLVGTLHANLSEQELAEHLRTFLTTEDKGTRETARKKLVSVGPAGVARLEAALASGVIYTPQPTGVTNRRLHLDFNDADIEYVLCVPANYRPDRSYPLLIAMHGTGGTGPGFYRRWYRHLRDKDVILAAPTAETPKRTKGYGATEWERQIPLAVIRDVRNGYHIDSDRVYLAGMSMGGHATWDNLLTYTDHYAAGIVECGIPMVEGYQIARNLFLPNLFSTGIYVLQGTPDKQNPQINSDAVNRLKRLGCDAVYVQFDGAGHGVYNVGSADALKWLWSQKREPWPKKVTKVAHRLGQAKAWWVKVEQMRGQEWNPRKRIMLRTPHDTPKDQLRKLAAKRWTNS